VGFCAIPTAAHPANNKPMPYVATFLIRKLLRLKNILTDITQAHRARPCHAEPVTSFIIQHFESSDFG
jgi:hypothetical protein